MASSEDSGFRFERGGDARTPAAGGVSGVSRRTLVAGAAWSVPAVTMMSVSPAFAAVSGGSLSVSAPNSQVPAAGAVPVTAVVKDASGQTVTGEAVSFSGPVGASFTPVSATTDGVGAAVTQMDLGTPWAKPGSFASVSAVSGSATASGSFTVLGSNVVVAGVGYSSVLAQSERVFPSPVVDAVAAGAGGVGAWFMVLLADGTVWTKGRNSHGQLGVAPTTTRSTWAQVAGLWGVTQIAAGYWNGYALLSDGSVRAWGYNDDGEVGDGSTIERWTPVPVSGLTSGVTQIAGGSYAGYALLSDGSVRAWGYNAYGQVGDGSTTNRVTPIPVSGLTSGVKKIAAGGFAGYALLSDGSVRAWGHNLYGQVGDGSTTNRVTPVPVSGLTSGVTQITGGASTGYALLSDGSVRAWGRNYFGQVGDGSTTNRVTPVPVSGLTSGVTQIVGGEFAGYALLSDGSVTAWGSNANGRLGDGSTMERWTPVPVGVPAGRVVQRLGTNSSTSAAALIVMKTS